MAAKINGLPFEHTMFYGPAGTGKTTLANIIANELRTDIIQRTGQEFEKNEVMETINRLGYMDVLFIDEVHSTPAKTLEILYGPLQIINNMKVNNDSSDYFSFEGNILRPFTFIGATTSAGQLTKPLRDRIVLAYQLGLYSARSLVEILSQYGCNAEAGRVIAQRARGVPRIALNYLLRIRNEYFGDKIPPEKCLQVFKRLGIDENGFERTDIEILKYLRDNKTASADELTRSLNLDKADYANMYEAWLLNQRMLKITSKGRTLTDKGLAYLEKK